MTLSRRSYPRMSVSWLAAVLAVGMLADAADARDFRYTENRARITHEYASSADEVYVRFDGTWTDVERIAFEARWQLVPVTEYAPHLGLGLYRLDDAVATDRAIAMRATRPLSTGQAVRVHVGVTGEEQNPVRFVPGQVILQLDRALDDSEMAAFLEREALEVSHDFWTPGYYRIALPQGADLFERVEALNGLSEVEFAAPDYVSFDDLHFTPNDFLYSEQWHLNNTAQIGGTPGADIHAEEAWDITLGDSQVLIAVIDSGVDLVHPDLVDNLLERPVGHDWSFDLPDSTGQPTISGWHGSAVASLAAGTGNNGIGVIGVAPGCTILPLRSTLNSQPSSLAGRADAINYAVSWNNIFRHVIINCAWDTSEIDDPGIRTACRDAFNGGCVVVASAGNDGVTPVTLPARYNSTLAVGSSTPCDTRAQDDDPTCSVEYTSESNFGDSLDVVAPGVTITMADQSGTGGQNQAPDGDYLSGPDARSGTSWAAPQVAGIAALIWSVDSTLTNTALMNLIRFTAEDEVGDPAEDTPGRDNFYGYGRVNAHAAMMATGNVRGFAAGRVRAAYETAKVPGDTLRVDPGQSVTYTHRIASTPVNAQSTDTVHVTGLITLHDVADIDSTVVEIGLISRAQRDSALVLNGNPADMLHQSVFVRLAVSDSGRVMAPGDYDAEVAGGVGSAFVVDPIFSFDLMLVPSDTTGGTAFLAIDDGGYGPGFAYGVDNNTALGNPMPAEDLSEAYLLVQMATSGTTGGTVVVENARAVTFMTGFGEGLGAAIEVLETGETGAAAADGSYVISTHALTPRHLVFTYPDTDPDTIAVHLAFADTLHQSVHLLKAPLGTVSGTLRNVTEVAKLDDATLSTDPGGGTTHDFSLAEVPVDAQGADSVFVTGLITLHDVADLDTTVVEFGLVTRAQRDSALVTVGDPSILLHQGAFARLAVSDSGRVMAPGDFDAIFAGGVGEGVSVSPTFAFSLRLAPSDTTGGSASLSIDGGPYGSAIPYGIDNGENLALDVPLEDFAEAYLVAQISSAAGSGGSVAFRNLRVETVHAGDGGPLVGLIEVAETFASKPSAGDGSYSIRTDALVERTLIYSAPDMFPDTATVVLAVDETIHQTMGLRRIPRATVTGRVSVASNVVKLADAILTVDGSATTHDHRIVATPVDAQNADTVHVSGTITFDSFVNVDSTRFEVGLISRAQRDSALITVGDPALMFDQSVFAQYRNGPTGRAVAPGDFDSRFAGGLGEEQLAAPLFSFDLRLVPSVGGTGGSAQLSVNGGPYGTATTYGTDNGDNFGGTFPAEDLSEAYLIAQLADLTGQGGSVTFRNVRVETFENGDGTPVAATVTVLETGTTSIAGGDGLYTILPRAEAELSLEYSAVGFTSDTLGFSLATGDTLAQSIGLMKLPAGSVGGTVTLGPMPTDSILVRIVPIEVTSDTTEVDGKYALADLPPGTYDIRFAGRGYGPRHVRNFTVEADSEHVVDLDLVAGFDDDLEFGSGAWTHQPGDAGFFDQWHVSGQRNTTAGGDLSWKCGSVGSADYVVPNWSVLEMPPIVVQPLQVFAFHHWIETSTLVGGELRHGGRVEASPDSGQTWNIIQPIGGYPYRTPLGYDGPLGPGTPIFSGHHEFEQVIFDLSAVAGDTLMLRFVFAADGPQLPREGWYLDDILVGGLELISTDEQPFAPTPPALALFQNAPNPFNPRTRIGYQLPADGRVVLNVFDLGGRLVLRLVDDWQVAGPYNVVWDGRDRGGRSVASGVYFYELRAAGDRLRRRMVLLR